MYRETTPAPARTHDGNAVETMRKSRRRLSPGAGKRAATDNPEAGPGTKQGATRHGATQDDSNRQGPANLRTRTDDAQRQQKQRETEQLRKFYTKRQNYY